MRFIVLLLIISNISLFSNTKYYNSNKSGMILNEINKNEISEYYIVQTTFRDKSVVESKFYKNSDIIKTIKETYNYKFMQLIKKEVTEDDKLTISSYENSRIIKKSLFVADELRSFIEYEYDENNQLFLSTSKDSHGETIYRDRFFRHKNGSLRKIERNSEDGYINYWYYEDGVVVETWQFDGESRIRTEYKNSSEILRKTIYEDDKVVSKTEYNYNDSGKLEKTVNVTGDREITKLYSAQGLVLEKNIIENDILVKKFKNIYEDGNLISETIGGHGLTEEIFYSYNDEDEIVTTTNYINKNLVSKNVVTGENSELIEYYKDGELYLKEYFSHKERVKRELFLDGVLFKSEIISE